MAEERLQKIFKERGLDSVIDITPIGVGVEYKSRSQEIKHWLDNNSWDNFVILDDKDIGNLYDFEDKFFKTFGITDEIKEKIINYFNI